MATRFDNWEGDYLAHFGTKGMKWGTRRYQYEDGSLTPEGLKRYGNGNAKRSARGVSRDLRRLEKEYAGSKARADYYQKRVAKSLRKAEIKSEKKGVKKDVSKRVKRMAEKGEAYKKLSERSRQLSDSIIKNALTKGYSIKSRDTMRFVRKGKDKGLMILGRKGTTVKSVKYHVKNNGLGVRTHKSTVGVINRKRHVSNFL